MYVFVVSVDNLQTGQTISFEVKIILEHFKHISCPQVSSRQSVFSKHI